jgi:hypothetical protein
VAFANGLSEAVGRCFFMGVADVFFHSSSFGNAGEVGVFLLVSLARWA